MNDVKSQSLRDELFAQPLGRVGDFRFDASVAAVFDDMIARSVPGYGTIVAMIPTLVRRHVRADTDVYDLGCSTGAGSLSVAAHLPPEHSGTRIHAIDSSAAMIDALHRRLSMDDPAAGVPIRGVPSQGVSGRNRIEPRLADVRDVAIERASLVLMNFTLQFIAPEERDSVVRRIAAGLLPGGALMLSEKVTGSDPPSTLLDQLHVDFKRAQGYSELEIAQKRTSLENTLRTDPVPVHLDRLERAGFRVAAPWFSCLGFVSILATK